MARITSKIAIAAAALPTGVFTAIEKARSSVQPQPPTPDTWDALAWMLTGQDPLAAFIAVASGVSGGWAIWQMFQPSPATPEDVKTDGRTTRAGVEHVSTQIAAEGQASDANHGLTHQLLAGELPKRVEVAAAAGLFSDEASKRIFDAVASRVGAEQAQRTVEQVEEVAERGDQKLTDLLATGAFAEAAAYQRSLAEQGDQRQAQAWRDTARISVLTSVEQAIRDYARATDLDPTVFWTWIELARLHMAAGSLPQARRAAEAARQYARDDRAASVAETELGGLCEREGELPAASAHYDAAMRADQTLAARDPDNVEWQRDLSISHDRLGDIARKQGDLPAAAIAYRTSLAIIETLAARDPRNPEWQRDLSVSHERLGDVARRLGDLPAAAAAYRASLAIAEALAVGDPGNAERQRDLLVSHSKLGDVAMAQGDLPSAASAYRASLAIAETLALRDPGNAGWKRDLSVCHNKLGDVARAQGDLPAAASAYRASLAIRETLAARDPGNADWKCDLSVSHKKLGDVARAQGDLPAAASAYHDGLAIAEALAARDPDNAEWQRDLFISHAKLAHLAETSLDKARAIAEFERAEAILLGLLHRVGEHPGFLRDLANVRADLARLRAHPLTPHSPTSTHPVAPS